MKRTIDIILSIVILSLFSPILFLIILLIKLESKGSIFFSQIRVGKNGKHFICYKFRTMIKNAEELKSGLMSLNEQDGPAFKIKKDPRITKIGKFLRKTSLDEFPQFINVLLGDMSIVGPRPAIPSEVSQYDTRSLKKLEVKPGITCIWQVSGRNIVSFDEWVEMDIEYINKQSLWFDFIIILKTIRVMFMLNGQ